jgi:16S rRNA (guanine527-N7)-methyltransferase
MTSLRPDLKAIATALGLAVTEEQAHALLNHIALLQRWNNTYNLTAVRDPAQMLVQHVADCLAVIQPLRRHAQSQPLRLLDVGSGGGLPGVIIAIMNPEMDVTCVDTVGKKAAFVQQVAAELGLRNLHAVHERVEKMQATPFEVITSRAFASLADFVTLTRQHLKPEGVWLAMKGKTPADELTQLPAHATMFHVEQIQVPRLEAERCLVWLRVQI